MFDRGHSGVLQGHHGEQRNARRDSGALRLRRLTTSSARRRRTQPAYIATATRISTASTSPTVISIRRSGPGVGRVVDLAAWRISLMTIDYPSRNWHDPSTGHRSTGG